VTGVKSYDEKAAECAYFMIRPDPCCPECTTIMDWRSTHRWIAITHEAEIRLSDAPSVGRHLHVLDLRVAHRKNRVVRQPKEWESKQHLHPVA
jgi:hypothetical protein